jgi:phage terminase large subunit
VNEILVRMPPKLEFLKDPHRYKVLYGGRGGAKSWGVARYLLLKGAEAQLRVLCAREFQNSIAESVHHLLEEQINVLCLQQFYKVQKAAILGINGTEFAFVGLRHSVGNLKSYEGFDICWVEEAQVVSRSSWQVLIPTIRKENSEIIVTFNPDLETDETFKRFVINPPPGAKVVKVNYDDNPWFPEVLRREMEHLKATDPDAYQHIWLGCCNTTLEGAIYANELRQMDAEGRIKSVPYDPSRPVWTFWDLGFGDNTSIWFVQAFPYEYRMIDFISNHGQALPYYLKELQSRGYIYAKHCIPHDGKAKQLGTGKSIEEMMRATGIPVEIVPSLHITDGINATRTLFPMMWFDAEKCEDGIQALRHYCWKVNQQTGQVMSEPEHDWASHPSDALRYMSVGIKYEGQPNYEPPIDDMNWQYANQQQGWMA